VAIVSGPPTVSVSSASFTGPAESLEIVGDHAYAYSGIKDLDGTFLDYLNFKTGNFYLVCNFAITGDWDSMGVGDIITQISLNDGVIVLDDTSAELAPNVWPLELIVSPYTTLKIEGKVSSGSGKKFSCILTGRIYRG